MDTKEEYIQKIDAIPTVSFNKEQKEIAKKIIAQTADADLSAVFGLITQRVKTGFVFDEAPEVNHNAVALAVENEKLGINMTSIGNDGKANTEHTLIIGENYDALKNLCATYIDKNGRGLIDVIYIDPPYNTEASRADGNDYKDEVQAAKFIYRDKFTRDGWLNMMNERLKLARRLLSDKGVIFISIDDSEQAYLKVLCDEIFGEENFVCNFVWQKKTQPSFLSKEIAAVTEYILLYKKTNTIIPLKGGYSDNTRDGELINIGNPISERFIKKDFLEIERGRYTGILQKGIYGNGILEIELLNQVEVKNGIAQEDLHMKGKFSRSQETLDKDVLNGAKIFIRSTKTLRPTINLNRVEATIKPPISLLSKKINENIPTNTDASNEMKKLFNGINVMDYPKPTGLIRFLIEAVTYARNNSTILDFFAGSGTTGQAVMELNEDDHGNRKFILVTNNENGIGEKITRERLYRVINGKGSGGEEIAWKYSAEKPCLQNNCVRVFGIETHELTLQDLDKAEKLKEQAKTEFKKLNPAYDNSNEFDVYNELAALNPIK